MHRTAKIGNDLYEFEAEEIGRRAGNVLDGEVEYYIGIYEIHNVEKNDEPCYDYDEDELIENMR